MKKHILVSISFVVSLIVILTSLVSADQSYPQKDPCISGVVHTWACDRENKREEKRWEIRDRREENTHLRRENSGALQDFRSDNSGAIRDSRETHSGAEYVGRRDMHDIEKNMSGKTVEERLIERDRLESTERAKIESKYVNNPELLAKRLAVYEQNKSRRDQIVANRMENLIVRSALTLEKIQVLDTQIRENMNNISPDRKRKLVTMIDKKLEKLSQAKGLTASTIAEITRILTTLKTDLTTVPIASV